MSTFLELCKDVNREAGLSGTGPASVSGQVGMDAKVVSWVKNAWNDIQETEKNWRFLWKNDGVVTCVQGQKTYDPVGLGFDLRHYDKDSFRVYLGTIGNQLFITYVPYETFRANYLFGNLQTTQGRPTVFTVNPDNTFSVWPTPNDAYVINFDYFRNPQVLANNTDTPIMPARFHQAIMYLALSRYSAHDENQILYQEAMMNYKRMMNRLYNDQLPNMAVGGAMV